MGLQKRLTLYGAIGLIAIAALLTYFSLHAVNQGTALVFHERLLRAEGIALELGEVLDNLRLEAEKAAVTIGQEWPGLQPPALEQHLSTLRAHLREHLVTIHSLDLPVSVALTDLQGKVLWAEPYLENEMGLTLKELPTMSQMNSMGRGYMRVAGVSLTQDNPSLSLAVPVSDGQGMMRGILVADMPFGAGAFDAFIRSRSHNYELQIVTEEGHIVSQTTAVAGGGESSHWEAIRSLAQARQSGVVQHLGEGGEVSHVVAYAPLPEIPLVVLLVQPEGTALALPWALGRRLLWTTVVGLTLMAVLAWQVSRRMVRPIERLAEVAQEFGRGNLGVRVPPLGRDEVGQLANDLEIMRQRLKDSLDEIRRWNEELERRVEQRTQELERLYQEVSRREQERHLLLNRVITAQEEERKRISRELHDEVGQTLSGLVMSLKSAENEVGRNPARAKERLESLRRLTTEAVGEIRRLIQDLRPSLLDDLGLVEAIGWYIDNYLDPAGIKGQLQTQGFDQRLPPAVEISLFRVVQEAITNIVKHSQAKAAWVRLSQTPLTIEGEIGDDGVGFDVSRLTSEASIGLMGMQERINLIGGRLEITSAPGQGTQVRFQVPKIGGERG